MTERIVDEIQEMYDKALCFIDDWELESAEQKLKEILELEPEYAPAYNKLGVVYARRKEFERAETCFSQAITLDPTLAGAYSNMGNIYQQKGWEERAMSAYEKAISLDPEHSTAHHNLGVLLKKQGRLGEGVAHLRKGAKLEKVKIREAVKRSPEKRRVIGVGWLIIIALIIIIFALRR